ncbi:Glycogenin-2 [Halotydeus destructor]|nr:Glycogenin-2 [Halotydeus destructor]
MAPSRRAWLTLATNDTYCMGALVTGNSLRNVNTEAELVVFITDQVTSHMKKLLAEVYDHIKNVDIIEGSDHDLLLDTSRPEWAVCMTKILGWRLTQYEKIVYIDSDAIAIKNCDELFDKPELSAVPDISWPDIFNSGVFVFEPNEKTFKSFLS